MGTVAEQPFPIFLLAGTDEVIKRVILFRKECKSGVAYHVHFQIGIELVQESYHNTLFQQTGKAVRPLVLKYVDRTSQSADCLSRLKYVFVGNAVLTMPGTVVTGVPKGYSAIRPESVAGEIRQHNVGHGAFQRVVLCQSAVVQLRHPSVGQLVAAL